MKKQAKKKAKAKKHKLNTDFKAIEAAAAGAGRFERNNKRGPGRPIGKRSNPAFRQYTVLIRKETHDQAIERLRKSMARPDFGEYVESLIHADLAG